MEEKNPDISKSTQLIPDTISMEFIRANKNTDNEGWITHITEHFIEIISSFKDDDVPIVCVELAETLHSARFRYKECQSGFLSVEMRILNLGLDKLLANNATDMVYQNPGNIEELKHCIGVLMTKACLEYGLGCAWCDRGRPIAGFDYLQRAQEDYRNLADATVNLDNHTDLETIWRINWYACACKRSETWLSIFGYLPDNEKPAVARLIMDDLTEARDEFGRLKRKDMETACGRLLEEAEGLARKQCIPREELEELYTDSVPDGYARWCNLHCLFLTFMSELNHYCGRFATDNLDFSLKGEDQWLFEDILSTFDHRRRKLYAIEQIDEGTFKNKGRDDDIEDLLDCHVRLFTLLDKIAKLMFILFPDRKRLKKGTFKDAAEILRDDQNTYLAAISQINGDITSDDGSRSEGTADPHRNYLGTMQRASRIRNHIVHNSFRIRVESEPKIEYRNTVSLTPLELKHHTIVMANNIREILLSLQLAVGLSSEVS